MDMRRKRICLIAAENYGLKQEVEWEMKVTYIYHSSFAVEMERSVLVFDYYGEGRLPEMAEGKGIYFLNSHGHPDHFKREILGLRERYPRAEYVLSRDIRLSGAEKGDRVHLVRPREDYEIGDLRVHTLRSTDLGVAFLVETEGKRIYHGGDLNWWHWEGESRAWNNNMAANYKREVDRLSGRSVDLAFLPLDPRLADAYSWGMKYFLEKVRADHVWPMHCWDKYEVCQKVRKEPGLPELFKEYHPLKRPGQEWELCW